jgi:hypothetical protein
MSGNALHRLLAFTHPHVKHVVTYSLHTAADENVANISSLQDEQFAHVRRQAVRIRGGIEVDQISALLPTNIGLKPTAQPSVD